MELLETIMYWQCSSSAVNLKSLKRKGHIASGEEWHVHLEIGSCDSELVSSLPRSRAHSASALSDCTAIMGNETEHKNENEHKDDKPEDPMPKQPLHPSVIGRLDPEYVAFHNKYLQYVT